jgi:Kinase non-catalytic C-lobe domain
MQIAELHTLMMIMMIIVVDDGECNLLIINVLFFCVSHLQILLKIGIAVYTALDFNLSQEEECIISSDLEQLINLMTYEGNL